MHSTSILLLAVALLATVAMARPGKRPWPGHHQHGNKENGIFPGHHEHKWSIYRLPSHIRLPRLLAGKLGQPWATFTAKKILDGKYLLISPALIFKLKEVANNTGTSTTAVPEISTTVQPDVVETTTVAVDEETTTVAIDEESTTDTPSFFKKRSFSFNDNGELLILDD